MPDIPDGQISLRKPTSPPSPPAFTAIVAAAAGLLVPSENDAPLEPFHWPDPDPLTPAALLAHLDQAPTTPVVTSDLAQFFTPLARIRTWHDEAQQATAARFAHLHTLIATTLTNVVVYRLGTVEVVVVIVGHDPTGALVGLRTTLIET